MSRIQLGIFLAGLLLIFLPAGCGGTAIPSEAAVQTAPATPSAETARITILYDSFGHTGEATQAWA